VFLFSITQTIHSDCANSYRFCAASSSTKKLSCYRIDDSLLAEKKLRSIMGRRSLEQNYGKKKLVISTDRSTTETIRAEDKDIKHLFFLNIYAYNRSTLLGLRDFFIFWFVVSFFTFRINLLVADKGKDGR